MGLAEKQAIRDLVEKELPPFQKILVEKGIRPMLTVDTETLPATGTKCMTVAGHVAREFRDQLIRMCQDDMAKTELNNQIDSVKIRHEESLPGEYDFTITKDGRVLIFTGNLNIFTINNAKQKSFSSAMTELL